MQGLLHSLLCFMVCFAVNFDLVLSKDGHNGDLWSHGIMTFTCLYAVVLMKIYMDTIYYNIVIWLNLIIGCVLFFVLYTWASNSIESSEAHGAVGMLIASPIYPLTVFFCFGLTLMIEMGIKGMQAIYTPDAREYIRTFAVQKKIPNEEEEGEFQR